MTRDLYVNEIEAKVLGPGFTQDVIACEDIEHEVIFKHPCDTYYTGILFPRQSNDNQRVDDGANSSSINEEVVDDSDWNALPQQNVDENNEEESDDEKPSQEQQSDTDDWIVKLYPYYLGMVTCVEESVRQIGIEVDYARYSTVDATQVRVRLDGVSPEEFLGVFNTFYWNNERFCNILRENNINTADDLFLFDNQSQSVSFAKRLVVTEISTDDNGKEHRRTNPVTSNSLPKFGEEFYGSLTNSKVQSIVKKLLSPSFYQRIPYHIDRLCIPIDKSIKKATPIGEGHLCYLTKVYVRGNKRYVKILIQNAAENISRDEIRSNCLFQTQLKVYSDSFVSYNELINGHGAEDDQTEFIYRKEKNYGKGIGVAICWDEEYETPHWIKTTYLPKVKVKSFSNKAENPQIDDLCRLYDLSEWTKLTDDEIINNLSGFISAYDSWHKEQIRLSEQERHPEITQTIIDNQQELINRLKDNLKYLAENGEAMTCFKIANTAMYIQMVIARDENFKKNRHYNAYDDTVAKRYLNLDYFKGEQTTVDPKYRPFQLAFLLMNVKSTMEQTDSYRKDYMDLIWFPTGGGKTEAYLALTALTIAARRRSSNDENVTKGVSVIMRYTLRLLTSQQFERASYLICALEFLRSNDPNLKLGKNSPITIGMWIGGASTPNKTSDLNTERKYRVFFTTVNDDKKVPTNNPFPLAYCPWCGCRLTDNLGNGIGNGFYNTGDISCINPHCFYHNQTTGHLLPVEYIDDRIYSNPPTLLFATVDKFALLTNANGGKLFGIGESWKRPNLIIQDELHLVSGPLGSMVGLFESMVEKMAESNQETPKIIASTATTRNTASLVDRLYNRKVRVFPPSGLTYDNNYFSKVERDENEQLVSKRMHLGVMPTGHTSVMTEINLVAIMMVTRLKMIENYLVENGVDINNVADVYAAISKDNQLRSEFDNYWSVVLYYNSLKDLGRTKSRIPQEIAERVRFILNVCPIRPALQFVIDGFDQRSREFTSREDSSKIKQLLTEAESATKISNDNNRIRVNSNMDIVQASNMISVGIDIARWNLMMMMGQPRSTSEYIQSSSRVARTFDGLVVNLMNPNRTREYSLFENYTSFHNTYYKFVEPLSATPFTEMTIDKLMVNIFICYVHHILRVRPGDLNSDMIGKLKDYLKSRCQQNDSHIRDYIDSSVDKILKDWNIGKPNNWQDVNDLFEKRMMKSLRSVDSNLFVKIQGVI